MPMMKIIPKGCKCEGKPDPTQYGEGSIWECDTCSLHWEIRLGFNQEEFWAQIHD